MIKKINVDWISTSNHSINFESQAVSYNGKGLINFRIHKTSLLRYLKLKSLNINDSEVYALHFLNMYRNSLHELSIKNTLVTDLKPIRKFWKLKTLKISKNQFTKEQLKIVPKKVTIVVEP